MKHDKPEVHLSMITHLIINTLLKRRTITELEEVGFSMGQAQYIAKDRGRWQQKLLIHFVISG